MCDTGTINSLKLHVVSQEPAIAVYAAPSSFGTFPVVKLRASVIEQRFTKRPTVPKNFDETCGCACGLQDLTRASPAQLGLTPTLPLLYSWCNFN